jgi:two-component system chemotaxis response regulator CheY
MGKRILIVDDATFIRMIVKRILVPKGYEIAGEAANGQEAVKQYHDLKPDLVTMDITMNEKDGLEAAKEILEMDRDARIIMVTALGQERMLVDSFKIGVKDFVVKPFKPERLLTAVEKALA